MKDITANTGYGYLKDESGRIIGKCIYSRNHKHKIPDNLTYHDVPDEAALSKIDVYKAPPTAEEIREKKIRAEIAAMNRETAISRLQARGEL